MMRLALFDLRDHAAAWAGAFAVAVACGCIGGWAMSLEVTAAAGGVRNAGSAVLAFSLVAAVPVLASTAKLTVASQRRSYALWQLANVKPGRVACVVIVQLAAVAVLGAVCGTLLAAATFGQLFALLLGAHGGFGPMPPRVGVELMPAVWLGVAGVFLVGGIKGVRDAGRTPPLSVLREPEPKRAGMTLLRFLLFACLAAATVQMALTMAGSDPDAIMDWSLYLPLLVTTLLVPAAPLALPAVLAAWTALVPARSWDAWYLARRTARFGLSASTSVETPVMVGVGLVAGIFSAANLWADHAARQGDAFTGIDAVSAILLMGGPVILCAVGAAVSVVMTSKTRTRDVALLVASGARPETLVAAAVCEALIHAVTATLMGMAGAVAASAIIASAAGLPLFSGLAFAQGLAVSAAGFVLVLAATLAPTWAALGKEAALVLAAQG